jgi:DNA repair protein RecO (recombination protein O)
MAAVTSDAIVLQVFPYGDTSRILKLLTATHGLRTVIAKGALRPRSRFGGMLEPFATGIATFHVREGREIQTLSAFDLSHGHQSLGADLLRFAGASLLAEILLRTASEEPQPHLFHHLADSLALLQRCDLVALESTILSAVWTLIARLGFAPELDACLDCGRTIDPAEDVRFDHTAGGVHCAGCAAGSPGRTLPARARRALGGLLAGHAATLERTEGHWRLLTLFLDHHVLEGSSLRSLAFLAETLDSRRCAG